MPCIVSAKNAASIRTDLTCIEPNNSSPPSVPLCVDRRGWTGCTLWFLEWYLKSAVSRVNSCCHFKQLSEFKGRLGNWRALMSGTVCERDGQWAAKPKQSCTLQACVQPLPGSSFTPIATLEAIYEIYEWLWVSQAAMLPTDRLIFAVPASGADVESFQLRRYRSATQLSITVSQAACSTRDLKCSHAMHINLWTVAKWAF